VLPPSGDGVIDDVRAGDRAGGRAILKVGIDEATGAITAATLQVPDREAPAEAW
jgi:hypothetical protein